eukprot:scaffold21575_cov172-Skeletonema_dohrnii-CCMP3373.AAC.2
MALPKASNVKDDVEKEQTNKTVTTAINNTDDHGGGGSGEAVNYEELSLIESSTGHLTDDDMEQPTSPMTKMKDAEIGAADDSSLNDGYRCSSYCCGCYCCCAYCASAITYRRGDTSMLFIIGYKGYLFDTTIIAATSSTSITLLRRKMALFLLAPLPDHLSQSWSSIIVLPHTSFYQGFSQAATAIMPLISSHGQQYCCNCRESMSVLHISALCIRART